MDLQHIWSIHRGLALDTLVRKVSIAKSLLQEKRSLKLVVMGLCCHYPSRNVFNFHVLNITFY